MYRTVIFLLGVEIVLLLHFGWNLGIFTMACDLPSALIKQEERILRFEKTAFILGRSGTGKTSILIKKLLQREKSFGLIGIGGHSREGAAEEKKVLRHLFVTANSKLCKVVKQRIGFDVNETEEDPRLGINSDSFPLVVTFHQFLIMLDNSLGSSFFDRFHIERSLEALESTFVFFEKFNNLYWSHFPVNLTKRLDSLRVYTEITSQIKGSENSLETASGKISREEYVLAYEGRSSLTQKQRQEIFQIFEVYEKLKREREEVDIADFQSYLYYQLSQAGYMGDKVDYVYVDEIQDLTISGIALFKFICPNMEHGFMFSGDTAQAISKGVDFRYQDVRSLFYRKFLSQCNNEKKEKGIVSDTFVLTENFRAHSGIVQLSQCVIDLLLHFFPRAVDRIDPEIGLVKGEPPVLLHYSYKAMKNVFGGGKKVEFGADQVFVVRDKSSRDQLSRIIGNQALVIDILECKGLEFQVFFYSFLNLFNSDCFCSCFVLYRM